MSKGGIIRWILKQRLLYIVFIFALFICVRARLFVIYYNRADLYLRDNRCWSLSPWIINFYTRLCQHCRAKSLLILRIPFCLLNPLKSTSEQLPTDFVCGLSSPNK